MAWVPAADGDQAEALRVALGPDVVLDSAELDGCSEPDEAIIRSLSRSDWFLLVASPLTAAAPRVHAEVDWWLLHRDPSRVVVVWTAGDIRWIGTHFDPRSSSALPSALFSAWTADRPVVDLRDVWTDPIRVRAAMGRLPAGLTEPIPTSVHTGKDGVVAKRSPW